MFRERGEIVDGSGDINAVLRERSMRRGALAVVATIGVGFAAGFMAVNKKGAIDTHTDVVEALAARDGLVHTEASTTNPDADSVSLVVWLGDCPLRATVSLARDTTGAVVDAFDYQMNVLSNTKTYDNGVGSQNFETQTTVVQNYDELVATYGAEPCDTVHST